MLGHDYTRRHYEVVKCIHFSYAISMRSSEASVSDLTQFGK